MEYVGSSAARRVAALSAVGAMLLGVLALVGWWLHLPFLTQVSPAYRAISPAAVAALLLLSAALLRLALGHVSAVTQRVLVSVVLLVSLYGLLELVGFLVGADLNREDAFTARLAQAWGVPFQPMSPVAGALMFLTGTALAALLLWPAREGGLSRRRGGDAAGALGAVAVGLAMVFVLSYLHGAPLLYGSTALPIAVTSALGFLLLGLGVVAAAGPAQWPLRPLVGESLRARLLRTFVPLAALAVMVSMVSHEEIPAFVNVNRALQSSLLAVAFAVVAALVATRVAAALGGALDRAQTAQREAQEALRQSEQRWATTLASIGDAVIATDTNGRVTFMNPVAERLTGWTFEEAAARSVTDVFRIVNEFTREAVESPVAKVLREGVVVGLANHTVLVRKDGTEAPIDDSGAPITGQDGRTRGVVLVFHDISERRQAEEAVRESEARYRSLFENMLDGYAYCRMLYEEGVPTDFIYLDVNSSFERLTGLRDVVGKKVSEVIPGLREANPELFETYGRVARSGQPEGFEVYLDQLGLWLSIAVYSPAPEHFVAVFDNITARKQAEEVRERLHAEMARQRELLETVVDNSRSQLVYLDRDFNFIWVNEAYAQACQRPRESFPGHNHFEFYPHAENEAIFRHVRETGEAVEFLAKPFVFPDHPEWGTTYWDWRLTPLKAESGEVEGFVFSLADVTESIRARERLLEAERARAELAEHLSDEIAHRVKNNLAMISGLLQMQMLGEPSPETAEALREAVGRIRTFVTLHEQMYATGGAEADLLAALQRIGTTMEELFAERGDVDLSVQGEPFRCDARVATNLSVIANELITNALKHGGPGAEGRRRIGVLLHPTAEGVELSVWNSGTPAPEYLDPARSQTMGLRLVYDIVVGQYQGRFSVRRSDGGTLAEVVVPAKAIQADSLPR